jgi:hypothetical protein
MCTPHKAGDCPSLETVIPMQPFSSCSIDVENEVASSEDLRHIAKIIGPMIYKETQKIFEVFAVDLLNEPITYIVPAIWGAQKDGDLTQTQQQISRAVIPVVSQALTALHAERLSSPQQFAIGYLIRELMIALVSMMVQYLQFRIPSPPHSEDENLNDLMNLIPLGNA